MLSPSESVGGTNRRIAQYLQLGVAFIWIIDPELRIVTIYRLGEELRVPEEKEELVGGDAMPGFLCMVSGLFHLPGERDSKRLKQYES